ncbi:hypothetical protein [Spartinivicinus poritis]|uniref:Uncharacterized protein n=1 Tax=Spartinivicinus poritis TaxID=2994640 RepID=A0ABT5UGY2_9GAMM|nr:hypothetical protein [Spartinivicinus sp. A2-2]MDE1465652.1 hypothetical protein [Spartinivicinus sp. A2-2]
MTSQTKQQRLEAVNELIKVIASSGRCFFSENADKSNKVENPFISTMEIDERGKIWYIDHYTRKRIYTHNDHDWNYFTHGGTLKRLVAFFRNHISKGAQIRADYFDPNGSFWGEQHPWAYGDDILIVKEAALRLGIAK